MPDKEKRNWEEREIEISFINQPIDFEVDFVVEETALDRAHRRWGMTTVGRGNGNLPRWA